MLIRFTAENHRSIKDPVELSMVAIDRDRPEARLQPSLDGSLVTVAGIYGPNASGKSNVVDALAWLSRAVRLSVRAWDDSIPTDPFSFGACSVGLSDFTLELMVDGVRYEYLLQIDCTHVAYEALFEYPENRRRRVFERTDQELAWQRRLPGAISVKQLWTPRTLVLSLARRFPDGPVRAVAQSVATIQASGPLPSWRPWGLRAWPSTMAWFEPSEPTLFDNPADASVPTRREQALALLRLADMGIEEVEVTTDEEPRPERL
ncbi:MAG: AAA family ATPase, partial [Propionibacteriaceae bacterium]|nr:AAA family ATPase [Propionibacteriaceae bacterium]